MPKDPRGDSRSHVVRFDLGQRLWSRAQIRPPPLDFHRCLGAPAFGFTGSRVCRLRFSSRLADELQ
jgi:hypothetical protein